MNGGQIALFERDSDEHVSRHAEHINQMIDGHHRSTPTCDDPTEIDRVPHDFIEGARRELERLGLRAFRE